MVLAYAHANSMSTAPTHTGPVPPVAVTAGRRGWVVVVKLEKAGRLPPGTLNTTFCLRGIYPTEPPLSETRHERRAGLSIRFLTVRKSRKLQSASGRLVRSCAWTLAVVICQLIWGRSMNLARGGLGRDLLRRVQSAAGDRYPVIRNR